MKKFIKGLSVLSLGVLIAGCSCSKSTSEPVIEEDRQEENKNSTGIYAALYNEVLPTTVRVIGTSSSNTTSMGSGVVYKEEGNYAYILTNAHVLTNTSNADYYNNVEVVFSNSARVKATYLFLDKNEDVGVIRIEKSNNYKVARVVGSDTDTKPMDDVLAIGQPNGQFFAPTVGQVTSTRLKTGTSYISGSIYTLSYVFNTTATINTGNSGGPLFNTNGELIAINTMVPPASTSTTTMNNHNYSIPANYFIKVANYIVNNRTTYVRPRLSIEGKSIRDYSTATATTLGLSVTRGVHVVNSSESEVANGRVITAVNGREIDTFEDFEFELLKYDSGEMVGLTICDVSGNNVRTVNVRMHQ